MRRLVMVLLLTGCNFLGYRRANLAFNAACVEWCGPTLVALCGPDNEGTCACMSPVDSNLMVRAPHICYPPPSRMTACR